MNIQDEAGFTLMEMVISLMILAIVFGVISSSIILGLKVTDETGQRVLESREAQIASAYFINDVQSAVTVTVATSTVGILPDYGPCSTGAPIVKLEGADYDASGTPPTSTVNSYVRVGELLKRRHCEKPPSGAFTLKSEITVVGSLRSSADPDVTCFPTDCPSDPSPDRVDMSLDVCGRNAASTCVFDAAHTYKFTLSGKRRPT